MKILLVADEEDKSLWDYYTKDKTAGTDFILSAGDLKSEYLSFLVTMVNRPVFFVPGNHDEEYQKMPPEGCDLIDGKLIEYNGIRIMGLGGSYKYNGGPFQYTERQMKTRINKLRPKINKAKGVDIIVAHAPICGYGDGKDLAHRGFECFLPLIEKYQPKYFIHGHVHQRYGYDFQREFKIGETTVINASGKYFLEV